MTILATAVLISVLAAPPPPTPTVVPSGPLTVDRIEAVAVAPGEAATVRIRLTVAEGYRIQANPASSEFLVPLTVELDSAAGIHIAEAAYPTGEAYRLHGSEEPLSTYRGRIEVTVEIRPEDGLTTGRHVVRGAVRFQGCTTRVCLFPASMPIEIPVVVTSDGFTR